MFQLESGFSRQNAPRKHLRHKSFQKVNDDLNLTSRKTRSSFIEKAPYKGLHQNKLASVSCNFVWGFAVLAVDLGYFELFEKKVCNKMNGVFFRTGLTLGPLLFDVLFYLAQVLEKHGCTDSSLNSANQSCATALLASLALAAVSQRS